METLLEKFRDCEKVTVNRITSGDFKQYGKLLDSLYHKLASGCCSQRHIFTVVSSHPTKMQMHIDSLNTEEAFTQELSIAWKAKRKKKKEDEPVYYMDKDWEQRRELILLQLDASLVVIKEPGLSDIKQIELAKKWGNLVPEKYKDDSMYDMPPEDVFARLKQEKVARKAVKMAAMEVKQKAKRAEADAAADAAAVAAAAALGGATSTTSSTSTIDEALLEGVTMDDLDRITNTIGSKAAASSSSTSVNMDDLESEFV